jgi:hypothetical protein
VTPRAMRIEPDVSRRVSRRCRLVASADEAWAIRGLEEQVATDEVGFVAWRREGANAYGGASEEMEKMDHHCNQDRFLRL